ncbi:MAG TPA: conjugal transfer protein TraG [Lachnospiraceae bacterium]|nr:conjugal transfer protein TraG [Lachnospiraceae bacterium]
MKKETKRKAGPPGRAGPSGKRNSGSIRKSVVSKKRNIDLSGRLKKLSGAVKEKLQTVNVRKVLVANIPYVIVFYLVEKEAWLYRHCIGNSVVQKLMNVFLYFGLPFQAPLPSIYWWDLMVGLIGAAAFKAVIWYRRQNAKKYRQGEEYGSARWGNEKDIAPFVDPVFENNVILTQTEFLTMNSRPKNWKYARNKNVIVIGGSGSGKTRYYVKPNLMQMPEKVSYVVTDPKGTIIVECGKMLKRAGYQLKVLNTINFAKSMHYNPFHYIRTEKDILKLVNTIIANTKGDGEKSSEDFWVKAERLLYCALIGFIYYEAPEEEQNFSTLLEFLNASEAREDDEEFQNAVDLMFEDLEAEDPEHFAVRQYKKYKLAAGKTAKSILISCGARLAPFDIAELREIMSYDEMELDKLGDRRTAMFVIISDTDDTFNFVVAIMYTQLFNLLCDKADDVYNGRLPYHVRLLLDEFANIGQIPKFDKLIATIRSREISASIILQSQSQLKTIYKDAAETIIGNCDTLLFLGGKEGSTLKEISETLGKETIDLYNTSDTRGQGRSYALNYQKTGKELMSRDELAVMDGTKCILQLRGVRPFFSDKYDITRHKRYRELSDYKDSNAFDVERYLRCELRMSRDEVFDVIEMEMTDPPEEANAE